jgi:hypothetical protein
MEIVINKCFGGFSLSEKACALLKLESSGREVCRNDPDLVRIVKELGLKANGSNADLSVITIPDGTDWVIEEYDGKEWVAEKHRTWH